MKNTTGYEINFDTKEIVITKKFQQMANIYGSKEYQTLVSLRKDFGDFSITTKIIKKKDNKTSYKGLTFVKMEMFFDSRIRMSGSDSIARTQYELDKEHFESVKIVASCKYATVKKWFLDNFKDEYSAWSVTSEYNCNPEAVEANVKKEPQTAEDRRLIAVNNVA